MREASSRVRRVPDASRYLLRVVTRIRVARPFGAAELPRPSSRNGGAPRLLRGREISRRRGEAARRGKPIVTWMFTTHAIADRQARTSGAARMPDLIVK